MSSLVPYDSQGPLGPAVALIYNARYLNVAGVSELTKLLKSNFEKLAWKPKGRKEFCANVIFRNTPEEVVGSRFFRNMLRPEPSPLYHEKVLGYILPPQMKSIQQWIPQAKHSGKQIEEWIGLFMDSLLTKEQIESQAPISDDILKERGKIGLALSQLIMDHGLTEKDLDILIDVSRLALIRVKEGDHEASTLEFIGKYLTLFSKDKEHPEALANAVLTMLTTIFRQKMFPKVV